MPSSDAAEFYRLYAAHCVEIARWVADSDAKATLLTMVEAPPALAD